MIEFINAEQTLPLRNEVLRNGKLRLEDCQFEGDKTTDAFHVGYFKDDRLIAVVSFLPQEREGFSGMGYRLRGMAVLPEYRKKGIGNLIANFGVLYLKGKKVSYVWCDARKVAYSFYLGQGFEFISDEFEIPEIGPHRVMYLKLS
ncbi:GNAT family N-acetyltransferase [Arcticibacter tournemirensis]